MDNTVGALNINGIIRVRAESLLSNNGIVHKVLSDGITVIQRTGQGIQVGGGDLAARDLPGDDVHLENIGGERSPHHLIGCDGGIRGGEDGEGSGSGKLGSDAQGVKGVVEFAKVFVSLEVVLLKASGDAEISPDLARSFQSLEGAEDVSSSSSTSSATGGWGGSSGGGCGSGRGGGNV